MKTNDLRMNAYYYGFNKTGVKEIDEILSCIAWAGKAFHHTAEWQDEVDINPENCIGKSPVDWIQIETNEINTYKYTVCCKCGKQYE